MLELLANLIIPQASPLLFFSILCLSSSWIPCTLFPVLVRYPASRHLPPSIHIQLLFIYLFIYLYIYFFPAIAALPIRIQITIPVSVLLLFLEAILSLQFEAAPMADTSWTDWQTI